MTFLDVRPRSKINRLDYLYLYPQPGTFWSLPTPTELEESASVASSTPSVYLVLCWSVCLQRNSKTNNTKVFKLDKGNDLEIA